jgi:hypothetical protein
LPGLGLVVVGSAVLAGLLAPVAGDGELEDDRVVDEAVDGRRGVIGFLNIWSQALKTRLLPIFPATIALHVSATDLDVLAALAASSSACAWRFASGSVLNSSESSAPGAASRRLSRSTETRALLAALALALDEGLAAVKLREVPAVLDEPHDAERLAEQNGVLCREVAIVEPWLMSTTKVMVPR